MGVSLSYNDVRRSRCLLAAYAVAKSNRGEVPLPSTFTQDTYTFGAMDNGDFCDRSSIPGSESSNVIMWVLYPEAVSPPRASDINLAKNSVHLSEKLPCQEVPHYLKPSLKPALPSTFRLVEETGINSKLDCAATLRVADKRKKKLYPS